MNNIVKSFTNYRTQNHRLFVGLLVTIQLICSVSVWAQDNTRALAFVEDSLYAGRFVYNDQPITQSFPFQVVGDSALTILEVESDCACVTIDYPKSPLQPTEKGVIKVAYLPYKPGAFEKLFTIKTNGNPKEQEIILTGYVEIFLPEPALEFPHVVGNLWFKNRHLSLGNITDEGVVRRSVEFHNAAKYPITLKDSAITPTHIEVIVNENQKTVLGGDRGSFDVYYHPEMKNDYGYLVDNVVLFTDDSLTSRFELTVTSIITQYFPPLETLNLDTFPRLVVPEAIKDIGRVTLSRYSVELVDFNLKNEGSVPLKIYRANAQEGCQIISEDYSEIAPADSVQLRVQVKDIGKSGTQERSILLYTNDPVYPVKPLKVKLNVRRQ